MTLVSTNVAVFKQKVPKVLQVQFFAENYFQLEVLQVRIDDTQTILATQFLYTL